MAWIPLADGQSLHVRIIGRGQPVLMLPGLGMSSSQWLPFVLPHSHSFRFYMPDFRGHGRSRQVTLPHADVFQVHADDVKAVISQCALDNYLLVGISLGATTAMHLEMQSALAGVRRYLHIDQSPCVQNQGDWPYGLCGQRQQSLHQCIDAIEALLADHTELQFVDQLPAPVRRELARQLQLLTSLLQVSGSARWLLEKMLPVAPAWMLRRLPLMRLTDMRAYLAAYRRGGYDYRPTLGNMGVPVTVMTGMQSALYAPAGQRLVADSALISEVVEFEQAGHVPLIDTPWQFSRAFSRFLHY